MPNYYSISTHKAVLFFKVLESKTQAENQQAAVNNPTNSAGGTKLTTLDVEAGLAVARAWLSGNVDGAQRKLMTAASIEQASGPEETCLRWLLL
jgi:hypothetical protein